MPSLVRMLLVATLVGICLTGLLCSLHLSLWYEAIVVPTSLMAGFAAASAADAEADPDPLDPWRR